jgi:hypothetical protein
MPDVGTGITAAASIGGSLLSSSASKKAAETQAQSADAASAEARRQYDITRQDYAPWRQSGTGALGKLDRLLGLSSTGNASQIEAEMKATRAQFDSLKAQHASSTGARRQEIANTLQALADKEDSLFANLKQVSNNPAAGADDGYLLKRFSLNDFQQDPGYQFRLGEGSKAIERSAASRGMQLSGATLKALQRYNQDFASNEYSNAWNRDSAEKQRTYNTLAGVAGIGQQATNAVATAGANMSNQVGQNLIGAGNAQAAGQVGSANALAGGFTDAVNNYQQQQLLSRLFPTSSGGGGSGGGFTNGNALSSAGLYSPRSLRIS